MFKTPIVGTYAGSFGQLLEDNVSGFLCNAKDPSSLLDAINRLLKTSSKDLEIIVEKAFIRSADLAPEKIAEQTEEFYKYVIKKWHDE